MEKSYKSLLKQKKTQKFSGHAQRSSESAKHGLRPAKPKAKYGWTPERRARHAAAMKQWKPWEKSTGPRTKKGKKRSAQNAARPYLRRDPDRMVEKALRAWGAYLSEIHRFIPLINFSMKNELLKRKIKNRRRALLRKGKRLIIQLKTAYIYVQLCSKLAAHHSDLGPELFSLIDSDQKVFQAKVRRNEGFSAIEMQSTLLRPLRGFA